jgi:hypothetical protein
MAGKVIYLKKFDNRKLLDKLIEDITEKTKQPQDYYEIAALLESFGWNDSRAAETFGVEDIFELAQWIWGMLEGEISFSPFIEQNKSTVKDITMEALRSFLRGIIFAMPMAISVLSMLTLRFSLWSYELLGTKEATSIAMGTILSFMTVGGFTQAIARKGFFYINQGFFNIGRRVTFYIVRIGLLTCIAVALIFWGVNIVFRMIPIDMMTMGVIYYLFLSSNWLAVTVMYILKKEIIFTGLITAGIAIVWVCFEKLKMFNGSIIYSQMIGLTFTTVTGFLLVQYFFKRAENKGEKGIAISFPRITFMIYSLIPYFLYGLFYFTFLYCDRLVAWSVSGINIPYIIWMRGDYELGLDFGLLMIILPMGFAEVVINRLMTALEVSQKNGLKNNNENLNSKYLKLYYKTIIWVVLSAIISSVIIYFIVIYINSNGAPFIKSKFAITGTILFVFIISLISYSLLSVALTNSIILFCLSVPEMVWKVTVKALLVNFTVGFLLSRWISYEYAVFGLMAGSFVFIFLSHKCVYKVLTNLDYYIYAAS